MAPAAPFTEALQRLIKSISETHSSPTFPPHVTLASLPNCISIEELVECLAPRNPVKLTFKDVKIGTTYFQSVFIAIQESKDLFELRDHVHEVLGIQTRTPNFPHMSLYYGEDQREKVLDSLRQDLSSLDYLADHAGIHEMLATEVWVVNCEGNPEEWSVIKQIQL